MMIAITIVLIVVAVLLSLLVIYAFLTYPGKRRPISPELLGVQYAHRGLHDHEHAENSLSAFRLAVKNGFGIELDVRLSKDGVLVVFHDDTLERVAGVEGRVIDYTAAELAAMHLSGTEDRRIHAFSKLSRSFCFRVFICSSNQPMNAPPYSVVTRAV